MAWATDMDIDTDMEGAGRQWLNSIDTMGGD